MRSGLAALVLLASAAVAAGGPPVPSAMPTGTVAAIEHALAVKDMTLADLSFDKDQGEPTLVLPAVRALLNDPLGLPALADDALAAVSQAGGIESVTGAWLGPVPVVPIPEGRPVAFPDAVPPALRAPLSRFVAECGAARDALETALAGVSPTQRVQAVAAYLGGLFDAEDDAAARAALVAAGLPSEALLRSMRQGWALDAGPASAELLAAIGAVHCPGLGAVCLYYGDSVAGLVGACDGVTRWPDRPVSFETDVGRIRIGTPGPDVHGGYALLVLDPGGDDVYGDGPGVGNGLLGHPLGAVIDLGGDDTYAGTGALGCASGVMGAGIVLDVQGDDLYEARHGGQGAAFMGVGWLEDRGGDDRYEAGRFAQGAAAVGLGVLVDRAGRDRYRVGLYGQAFAGPLGVAWLVDRAGADLYEAGGLHPDFERHETHYLSLAQGFSIGMRPLGGGGIAVLADLAGNDTYIADVYGQGVGYWYSVGMLLDLAGDDVYSVWEYGQGTGIHLSAGLLADFAGNDRYGGHSLSQGSAHDFAVGMLFDHAGTDTYTADHFAQGQGINNALGLLVDARGADLYAARREGDTQGHGHFSEDRGYGSLSLLIDLQGRDRYTSGATNGCLIEYPHDGVVYDVAP